MQYLENGWDRLPAMAQRALPALLGTLAVYYAVFTLTQSATVAERSISALTNAVPLCLVGAATFRIVRFAPTGPFPLALWHMLVGSGFVSLWYSGVVLCQGVTMWMRGGEFAMPWFSGPGLTWQLLQGACLYGLISAISEIAVLRDRLSENLNRPASKGAPAHNPTVLLRRDDEYAPIDLTALVAVEGADDYANLHFPDRQVIARMSLAQAEEKLAQRGFVRVHRSWLVALDAIECAEPLGNGRWQVRLHSGLVVPVSRNGMRELRRFVF